MSQWRQARPEIILAAVFVAVAALTGVALAGWPGLAIVATGTAIGVLLVLRGLAPRPAAEAIRKSREADTASMRSISGYSQRRFVVASGMSSRAFYEADLRPALEHLLAARLAERHGLNLYTDPAGARQAFVRTAGDEALWGWIDPMQAVPKAERERPGRGIPRRTLARLINRLEQL
jgi:hypothetical protein